MIGASQRRHREAMRERSQARFRLVRRARGHNEINRVQMKSPLRRLRHRDVARVNRIERASEKRDGPPVRFSSWLMRGGGRQRSSGMRAGGFGFRASGGS